MKNNDLESLVDEALSNIRDDRKAAREFLNEIANLIANNTEENRHLSPVAAKHIETLQRSNEQLVKLAAIVHKKEATKSSENLTELDKDELFDIIQSGGE